ncbi:hypothetical protein [Clostridium kluyveri]|uniref:Uncharacterized protein n=1 Tax=Clostridium kluyveri (strain ATCC 8527 / DSM 555 / NBRC 12016 / NCIMB 10680 / K1) TaxID=431943 RepID=A5F9Q5_CLOK5|nr:hypothetical protein [Clostridium kluyveri]ABQ23603.1 hypothetical protein CKL_4004 [Clostridium kluyveri DSM 555]
MKYTVEITPEKMVKKFIDDNGKEYINTWIAKGPGHIGTLEKAMDDQMDDANKFSEELLQAIYDEDLGDIWREVRNSRIKEGLHGNIDN